MQHAPLLPQRAAIEQAPVQEVQPAAAEPEALCADVDTAEPEEEANGNMAEEATEALAEAAKQEPDAEEAPKESNSEPASEHADAAEPAADKDFSPVSGGRGAAAAEKAPAAAAKKVQDTAAKAAEGNEEAQADEEDEDDICHVCGEADEGDVLLLCDGCDKACHLGCARPVLRRIPKSAPARRLHATLFSACSLKH